MCVYIYKPPSQPHAECQASDGNHLSPVPEEQVCRKLNLSLQCDGARKKVIVIFVLCTERNLIKKKGEVYPSRVIWMSYT